MSGKQMNAIDELSAKLAVAKAEIGKRIIGQDRVVDQVMTTILSGGHCLLVGAPGLAKTRLVNTIGTVMGLNSNRIQFTPDLMPADILGSEVLENSHDGTRNFRFIAGPVFCQLLMADEINRASPRTQSALLQAMQENYVTISGKNMKLPQPFHVLATQNPIEQEGTYPLPEAQLDRFLLQVDIHQPDRETERKILLNTTGSHDIKITKIITAAQLHKMQGLVRDMPVSNNVLNAILDLLATVRPDQPAALSQIKDHILWGPGPRAAQALMLAVRARALLRGDYAPCLSDVSELAHSVLVHRISLGFKARSQGIVIRDIIRTALSNVHALAPTI